VRHRVQAGGDGPVEVRLELRPRYADLGPAEPEGDQALRAQPVVGGEPRGLLGGLQAMKARSSMPRRVEENGVMVSSA